MLLNSNYLFSKVIERMHFLYQIVSNAEVYYLLLTFLRLTIKIHHQPVLAVNAVNMLISIMQISSKISEYCKQVLLLVSSVCVIFKKHLLINILFRGKFARKASSINFKLLV